MSLIVSDCPRCGSSEMTFDVMAQVFRARYYQWQNSYEIFSVCRRCQKPTTFIVALKTYELRGQFYQENGLVTYRDALNPHFEILGYVNLRENVSRKIPDHVPEEIGKVFQEASTCLAVECYNAAACMFRLCVDLATRPLLPDKDDKGGVQPNEKQRRDLGLRLPWLFDNHLLPDSLRELAKCIREDANDGAHVGNLGKPDAEDLADFTESLMERLYTEPEKLRLAQARRDARRTKAV